MYLVVTRSFPPELGGMQNLMWGLTNSISKYNLTKVFAEIGKIREQIAMLPEPANLQPILDKLKMLEEYGWELEEDVEELSKDVAIVKKENELQDVLIEEIKQSTSNPLGG